MITEPTTGTLDQIDALLNEEPEVVEPTNDETEQEGAETGLPDDTNEPEKVTADEQVGDDETEVEEDGVDYDLMVPMADGRDAIKLGDMKDMVNDFERQRGEVEQQRIRQVGQETELNNYMQQMGIQVPPEFKQHMEQKQQDYLRGQHKLMMKMMPEAAEPEQFNKMREGIVQAAKGSNFTPEEISKVGDARIVHLLHRLAKLEAREKAAHENAKQIRKAGGPKGIKPRVKTKQSKLDKQVADAAQSSDRGVKDAAIKALIG